MTTPLSPTGRPVSTMPHVERHNYSPPLPNTTFAHNNWHAWTGTAHVLLSDEGTKSLRYFTSWDACINWLYVNDHKVAARALNKHIEELKCLSTRF